MAMSYQSSGRSRILGLAIALVVGIHQALAFDIMPTPGSGDSIQFVKCESASMRLQPLEITEREVGQ